MATKRCKRYGFRADGVTCRKRAKPGRRTGARKSSKRKGVHCKVVWIKRHSVKGRKQKMCWNSKGRLVKTRRRAA